MNRREFLRIAAGAAGAGLLASGPARRAPADTEGPVAHVLPTVSDRRFWAFDVRGLAPARRYTLELWNAARRVLEPWPLATFPHPHDRPQRLRVLAYTCAGGDDFFQLYVPIADRRRLLRRALDFGPDAVLALGDHIYWDRIGGGLALFTRAATRIFGFGDGFDPGAPVLGNANEDFLSFIGDRQIAALYGTLFRSVPVFFARDDHDYFEDDREEQFLFPADRFMRALAAGTQRLYYPELLPDPGRPPLTADTQLPGASPLSEAFGTLRYGRLAELLLYDCKGFATPLGVAGGLVPADVERWLIQRLARSPVKHVVQVPSNPMGWSAGKPAEWYADVVGERGLDLSHPKQHWNPGWRAQHDRLLRAASARRGLPLVVSGDLHSVAKQRITRSGAADLSANPVVSLIVGTPATGPRGWPSAVRGLVAARPAGIEGETVLPVTERNGFQLLDFEPGAVTIRHFLWSPGQPIETLEPAFVSRYATCPPRTSRTCAGAPERTRTSDTRFRKPLLYPSELRGRRPGS